MLTHLQTHICPIALVEGSQMENIPAANEAKCCVEVESQQDSFQDDQISVSDMLKYKD